ncbi:MAG: hypothetical protein K8Q89_01115 [Nitrosarchaeum sp.]|nr:hypothetical protein [Nitrosarchaeum sp.]
MKLETYAKIGISVGITAVCIMIFIMLVMVVPNLIGSYVENLRGHFIDRKQIMTQMLETPSHDSFITRFPDYRANVIDSDNDFSYSLEAINPNTLNSLRLILQYDFYKNKINEIVSCSSLKGTNLSISSYDTAFQDAFIKNTDCLDDDFEFPSNTDSRFDYN